MVAYAKRKRATADELAHLRAVREMPCCIQHNQTSPTEAHHIKRGNKRLGHYFVLPYCHECHETAHLRWRREKQLWEGTMQKLGRSDIAWPVSKIVSRSSQDV